MLAGTAGIAAELGLLGHYEDAAQWIPLVVLGTGAGSCIWVALRPSRPSVRALQAVMAACALAGLLGVYFHLRANFEFEMEMMLETLPARAEDASFASLGLLAESLRGALPALAPAAMVQLGLLGMLAGWRHPALHADRRTGRAET